MAFSVVNIAYKQEAAAADINQLQENVRVHDHRPDGSQGAALRGDWVDCTAAVAAAAGFALSGTQRYRLLLGGLLVEYDFAVTRSGATLVATDASTNNPGGIADTNVITGIPAEAAAGAGQNIIAANAFLAAVTPAADGSALVLVHMGTSHQIRGGQGVTMRGILWRA